MLHSCPDCGLAHEAPGPPPTNPEVEIARIQAERDVKVAQLANRQEHDWNETRVEVAEIEGDAQVATAEAEAAVIGEILNAEGADPAGPEPIPIVVDGDPEPEPEPEPDVPPPPAAEESAPPAAKRPSGMWAGYR